MTINLDPRWRITVPSDVETTREGRVSLYELAKKLLRGTPNLSLETILTEIKTMPSVFYVASTRSSAGWVEGAAFNVIFGPGENSQHQLTVGSEVRRLKLVLTITQSAPLSAETFTREHYRILSAAAAVYLPEHAWPRVYKAVTQALSEEIPEEVVLNLGTSATLTQPRERWFITASKEPRRQRRQISVKFSDPANHDLPIDATRPVVQSLMSSRRAGAARKRKRRVAISQK